jgi:hypothetical protein
VQHVPEQQQGTRSCAPHIPSHPKHPASPIARVLLMNRQTYKGGRTRGPTEPMVRGVICLPICCLLSALPCPSTLLLWRVAGTAPDTAPSATSGAASVQTHVCVVVWLFVQGGPGEGGHTAPMLTANCSEPTGQERGRRVSTPLLRLSAAGDKCPLDPSRAQHVTITAKQTCTQGKP